MGIPRFYKWLRTRYPQIRMDLTDSNKQIPIIDNLYLDFNGIVYRCIADFQCFLKSKFDPLSIQQIYERVFQYLMIIISKVDPQKLIFIAFDGVAPRAKINQSRDRRFRAIQDRQNFYSVLKKLGIEDKQLFQQNSISPGTDFLTNLCMMLKKRVMSLFENQWRHLKVFFSDCLAPGEGQHKIMDFLRQSKRLQMFDPKTTHCVYSADADVILLSISLNIENICIIRQDSTKMNYDFTASTNVRHVRNPQFQFIFLNILRQYFRKQFRECLLAVKSNDVQLVINDFITLMAFVGNDFLPVQFCFTIKQSHMENLFNSYKKYLIERKKFINNSGFIDWSGIQSLLEIAKKFQAQMLEQKIKNKRNLISQRQMQKQSILKPIKQQKSQQDQQNAEDDEVENFQVVDSKIVKGKQLYYKTRFQIEDINNDPKFTDIIVKYIQGLQFYNQYYFLGVPSWTWSYPYHYTPLLSDVYEYISKNKVNVKLNKGQPFDPFLALMFMLPEESFGILPLPLANILKDPKCQLRSPIDYYPKQFKLDKYQTLNFHKRALIPFLKEDTVRRVYQSIERTKYTEKQRQKNSQSKTVYFKYTQFGMSGAQVYFGNQELQKDLINFIKQGQNKKLKQAQKQKFPSLDIYGDFNLDENGKIEVARKYKHQGNPNQLVFFNHFLGFVQQMDTVPQGIRSQIQFAYRQIGISAKCGAVFRVKQARFLRQFGRFSFIKTKNEVTVPDFALFKVPKYEYIPEVSSFQWKDLYRADQRVIILNQKHFGYVGAIEKLEEKQAKIKLLQPSYTTNFKIQENQMQFYTLQYVAEQLDLNPDVVLAILDQLIILPKVNKKTKFDDHFPTRINMGLNIINTQKGLILPHYARCQMEHQNTERVYEIFKKVELSESCIQVLRKYIQNFEWIVQYLQAKVSERDFSYRKGIFARNIISLQSDVNLKIYSEFYKLYKFGVDGKFYSVYSKVANQKVPQINPTPRLNESISLPYYQFISKRQAKICPPALRAEPQFHDIGDRVLLVKTFQVGYIIGIDDNKVWIQVGKRDEPLCVSFLDAFNINWSRYLMKDVGKCWSMDVSYFSPQHYTKVKGLQKRNQ